MPKTRQGIPCAFCHKTQDAKRRRTSRSTGKCTDRKDQTAKITVRGFDPGQRERGRGLFVTRAQLFKLCRAWSKSTKACAIQVGPALLECAEFEIEVYPNCSQNHTPIAHVLIFLIIKSVCSKESPLLDLLLFRIKPNVPEMNRTGHLSKDDQNTAPPL